MVAAAAAGVLASPSLAAPLRVVGDEREGTGREAGGGGAGRGVVSTRGGAGASGGLPINTVVVVDAGSSGCRLNVYRMDGEGDSLKVSGTSAGKIEPGLSSFADSPEDVAAYIVPLFEKASELVPVEDHSSTKIYIKSTAGMRLLPEETQDALYDEIYDALVMDPGFPFALDRASLGTIEGDKEAFYAVLSANYLEGRIDARLHPTGHGSGEIGALDMGGASTQIIFRHKQEAKEEQQQRQQPEQQQQQDDDDEDERRARENGSGSGRARVSETPAASQGGSGDYDPLDNRRVPLEAIEERGSVPTVPVSQSDFWGASHLGFGVAEVRLRIWDSLVSDRSSVSESLSSGGVGNEIPNPCSFVGRVDAWKGHRLIGTGDHSLCETTVASVLWGGRVGGGEGGDGEWGEEAEVARARGVGGVSMPALNGEFLAMSVFFFAMHCLHELGPAELTAWPAPTLAELRTAAEGFCAMDWRALSLDDTADVDHEFTGSAEGLAHRCVEVVYMTTLLRDGYGFPEHSRNVTYALESDGMELEWTLGFALAELARLNEMAELEGPEELAEPEEVRQLDQLEDIEGFRERQELEEREESGKLGELEDVEDVAKRVEDLRERGERGELEELGELGELGELQELERGKEINEVEELAHVLDQLAAEAAAGGGDDASPSVGADGTVVDAPAVVPGAGAGVAEMAAENAATCARAVKTSIADMDGGSGGGGGGGGGGNGGGSDCGGDGGGTEAFALATGKGDDNSGRGDGAEGGGGEANAESLPKGETRSARVEEGDRGEKERREAVLVEEEEEEEEGEGGAGGVTWLEECPAVEGLGSSRRAPGKRGRGRGGEGGSSPEGAGKALAAGEFPREGGADRSNSNDSSSSSGGSGTCGLLAGREAAMAAVAATAAGATWSGRLGALWKRLWRGGAGGVDAQGFLGPWGVVKKWMGV